MDKIVIIKYGDGKNAQPRLYEQLGWAKEHCPSYITNDSYYSSTPPALYIDDVYYRFYFSEASDATLFALRWS
jgi:hypothetical protein